MGATTRAGPVRPLSIRLRSLRERTSRLRLRPAADPSSAHWLRTRGHHNRLPEETDAPISTPRRASAKLRSAGETQVMRAANVRRGGERAGHAHPVEFRMVISSRTVLLRPSDGGNGRLRLAASCLWRTDVRCKTCGSRGWRSYWCRNSSASCRISFGICELHACHRPRRRPCRSATLSNTLYRTTYLKKVFVGCAEASRGPPWLRSRGL